MGGRVIIGVGNDLRRDDGVGPAVVDLLRSLTPVPPELAGVMLAVTDGEPTRLIDLWAGADLAVVVNAMRSPTDPPGRRYELNITEATGTDAPAVSSHHVGFGETVALAGTLNRLPRELVVLAVTGADFGFGAGLDPAVADCLVPTARRVREVLSGHG
ncbi:hydrogenase maturation protease [Luedemannella helvata]|uniref:Hydrogenase maturation protease n=1 Tax=Luedemannella helvata TaxID=349315 RepID=A0ABP4WTJ0_9ACTN